MSLFWHQIIGWTCRPPRAGLPVASPDDDTGDSQVGRFADQRIPLQPTEYLILLST